MFTLLEILSVSHISCLIRFVKLTLPRAFVVLNLMSHLFDDYLILNELTLFYFNFSATAETNEVEKIENWTAHVEKANKNKKTNVKKGPSFRTATSTTAIRTTTTSAAVVTAPTAKPLKKVKLGPKADGPTVSAFLEEDESAERDAAISSPIKGKKRLSSKVRRTNSA